MGNSIHPSKTIKKLLGNVNEFDAVLFHTFGLSQFSPIPNPVERKPHQRYVMFLQEPPLMDLNDHAKFNNFFNWTATYRWDNVTNVARPFIMLKC